MKDYKEQVKDKRWIEKSKSIMKRDGYKCQLCGRSHTELNVHHIKYINGLDYWDYPDDSLMTVCSVCHAKIHGKPLPKKTISKKNIPLYNVAIRNENLSANDKIIYSYLIFQKEIGDNDFEVKASGISKDLNISLNTVKKSILKIKELGLLDDNKAIYPNDTIEQGYCYLQISSNLKGETLIVYSYLKHKSKNRNNIISTYDKPQSQELKISKKHYQKILCQLYKIGLAKRLDNGRLKIN